MAGTRSSVVLPGANATAGTAVAERLRRSIEAAEVAGVGVTSSFGVSTLAGRGATPDRLYRTADQALCAAKLAGRNRVRLHEEPVDPRVPAPA